MYIFNFSLGLGLLVADISDVDRVLWDTLGRFFVLVHVRGGNCEYAAVIGEREAGNRRGVLVELAEPLLVLAVPNVDQSIGSPSGERVKIAMEGYGIHRIYVFDSCKW